MGLGFVVLDCCGVEFVLGCMFSGFGYNWVEFSRG